MAAVAAHRVGHGLPVHAVGSLAPRWASAERAPTGVKGPAPYDRGEERRRSAGGGRLPRMPRWRSAPRPRQPQTTHEHHSEIVTKPARCHIEPAITGPVSHRAGWWSGGPFPPNGLAVCLRTTARTGTALRRGIIEPGRTARREPRQCHIVVVLTTATSHHGGSAVRDAGAVVIGAPAGVAGEAEASLGAGVRGEGPFAPHLSRARGPSPHRTAEARARMGQAGVVGYQRGVLLKRGFQTAR